MSRIQVCPTAELPAGERTIVDTDTGEIGVFNVGGEFYAAANACPHRDGPVCTGKVQGTLVGRWPGPGKRIEERLDEAPAIACPWHGWEFDLASGDHLGDDTYSIVTYDVIVEDDTIYLDL